MVRGMGMVGRGHLVAGERNGMHKLIAARVQYARRRRLSSYSLAARWGIDPSTVRKAVRGATWRYA